MAKYSIPTDKEIAERAKALITGHLGRPITITELALQCGVTVYSLKRIFKKVNGQSIAGFSLQSRMDKAKELLITTNNTLQMVAEDVGYTESTNFQNIFKRVVGITPGEWRRQYSV